MACRGGGCTIGAARDIFNFVHERASHAMLSLHNSFNVISEVKHLVLPFNLPVALVPPNHPVTRPLICLIEQAVLDVLVLNMARPVVGHELARVEHTFEVI